MAPTWDVPSMASSAGVPDAPEGTTVLAVRTTDGVVMAGDRRATAGNIIAHRRVQKVYSADDFSAVAISGTAGLAVELIKLFQTELEHYEKLEGTRLSLEGKANHLASMVRNQLPLAFQGLVVIPLFSGYDERASTGHLYTYDVVGGRYEEQDYATTGSGGMEASAFLKGVYRDDLTTEEAVRFGIEGLVAAAEEDTATGGPDLRRGIYPTVVTVTASGFREIPEEEVASLAAEVVEGRP
ncbi:MAG: proteasome subunit beta [Acidimicrobiia bacterium]|nr:proteasome subunit beta [Acidimicrobiia bacterium]